MGWLEGALRAMPAWEINAWGHTVSFSVLVPALVVPGIFFTVLAIYPFVESWVTGDKREHHLLERPRNAPTRTAIGAAGVTFFGLLWLNGGKRRHRRQTPFVDLRDHLVHPVRALPRPLWWRSSWPGGFAWVCSAETGTRCCTAGESGIIRRLPSGEYIEIHEPVSVEERYVLTAYEVNRPLELMTLSMRTESRCRTAGYARSLRSLRWYFGTEGREADTAEYQQLTAGHHH
jgi:ubiquinol-cytochrome c reductase cytochrome b subunit